ncbi:MAG: orotidine-5'-phosphate decarboxylase [Bacteroidota bacterium]
MSPDVLYQQIQRKGSFLCVGLDSDPDRIPTHLQDYDDPIYEFNRQIINATKDFAVAYKPNLAFYEAMGSKGWETLEKTLDLIPEEIMTIADAKRGDIGNTSRLYAQAFFETFDFDAVTVAPYMGKDSVGPFLEFEGKWVFLLALTSNPSAQDFQYRQENGELLYQQVVKRAVSWQEEYPGHLGFVVGATRAESIGEIRALAPDNYFLVPGVGAQGGDLQAVCAHGQSEQAGLLINSSRGIIFAGQGEDFAEEAGKAAQNLQAQMKSLIK